FYHDLHARFPIDEYDHFILSELMLNINDTDEALRHINVFLHKNHNHVEGLNRRGYIFLKKEELQEAYFDLSHAHRIHPHHAQVNSNLGLYFLKKRQFAEAEEWMNMALKNDASCGLCWFNKGLWNEEKWRWAEALNCFEQAEKYGYQYHGLALKIAEMDNLTNHSK
ncbi:MAG: tetratricopeptide repeat protein, partial [Bacteroidota bacterium]